ncbi:CHAP domain-containing protein [Sphingobacterium sp. LRF_L2]|uniref:CHAP domain-containing protein n=1 Tax=Sphingobacterium sp. LRF_L2 TaxID=3369421 RepID=UPI003F639D19
MATGYSLFFGVLLIGICLFVGFGDRFLSNESDMLDAENVLQLEGEQANALESTVVVVSVDEPIPDLRQRIVVLAEQELGVKEKTGNNDGDRVEEYLRYTGLGKGHAWCAAFVCWCYGESGLNQPKNPWSPALFPTARSYCTSRSGCDTSSPKPADLFGIYSSSAKRINHVGLIKTTTDKYIISIEGNVNNQVQSKRRHLATVYALSDWILN